MKIVLVFLAIVALTACSTTYTAKDLMEKGNKNLPYTKEAYGVSITIDNIKNISFDKSKQRVMISLDGKIKLPLLDESECEKIHFSLKPYLKENELRIKNFKADGVDCLTFEKFDTIVVNLLKDIFLEDDLKIFELSSLEDWLVDDIRIDEDGLVIEISWF
jgi:hypothetical protein